MLTITKKIPWNNVNDLKATENDGAQVDEDGDYFIEVEVSVPENLQEAVNDCGGEDKLVDALTDAKINRALTNGRNLIRNAKAGTVIKDLITKAKNAVKEFSFATAGDRVGVKQRAENASNAMDYLKGMSEEELAALSASPTGVEDLRKRLMAELMKK